jgi:uncharacterized protein
MGKILFWLGVFAAVFLVLKGIAVIQRKGTLKDGKAAPDVPKPTDSQSSPPPEHQNALPSLVACKKCGLHLPRQEAVERRGQYFCSVEHAD